MKIAFLFLVINSLFHESIWINFFKGHEQEYSLYVHSKEPLKAESWLNNCTPVPTQDTDWARTMKAQIALWREALKDPDNQKFILISESTLPLVPFDEVKNVLATPKSIFWYTKNFHSAPHNIYYEPRRSMPGIDQKEQYKNYQWIILNRHHAQLLVDTFDESLLPEFFDQEHYPSTILAKHINLNAEVVPRDLTYACWDHPNAIIHVHPYTFIDISNPLEKCVLKITRDEHFYFARKFAPYCKHIDEIVNPEFFE